MSEQLEGIFNVIPDLATPLEVETALRAILEDESLEILWWDWEAERYVDVHGTPVAQIDRPGRSVTKIEYETRKVGLIIHDPKLLDRPEFLTVFIPMMRIAMERDRLHRDLNKKIDQLHASRQRLIEASEAERRRLERNLHDGAQQRLTVALLELRSLERTLDRDDVREPMARAAREELEAAIADLRELARGLHPPLLARHGLAAAVQAGADRASLPIELELQLDDAELPDTLEAAAYYVSAEAVTNAVKHAQATQLWLRIAHEGPTLIVDIRDDGVGGASEHGEGTGLEGIRDRVEALDGWLRIESPPGAGTRLVAVFPVGA